MANFSPEEIDYSEEAYANDDLTHNETRQNAEPPASGVDTFLAQVGTLIPRVCRIAIDILSRNFIGRIVLRAMEQAKLKRQEQHIKARIREMVNEGEFTVVSIDVLDELDDTPVCTVEVECQQVDEFIQPGDVIHNLVY